MAKADPRAEYERRRELRRRAVDAQVARSRRFSNLRVLTFVVLLAMAGAGVSDVGLPLPWAVIPLVLFVGLVIAHEGVERARARAALAVEHYDRALRRVDGRWQEDGPSGEEHVPHDHIYAADLDLFGPASLFTLLCTARTRGGESTLAGWLLAPANPAEIRARQAASAALRERLDLRESLALLGGDLDVAVDPEHLRAWGEAPPKIAPDKRRPLRALAWILALAATAALVAWLAFGASLLPLAVVMGVEVIVGRRLKPATEAVTKAVEAPRRELDFVARLLAR
ncbi:MAG: DNA mismatch repair protein MutS, partial [Myxococcales bacterium]|nr:DNA mismatch repair protein MutS [Myxococcales bacterium]